MTLPQVYALDAYWHATPPAALQLRRIAQWLGIKDPPPKVQASAKRPPPTPESAIQQAMAAGIPVFYGRPNDPMLDLLDL